MAEDDGVLTVGELRKILEDLPDDMPVVHDRCSDVCDMERPTVEEVLPKRGHSWYEWFHENQWTAQPKLETIKVLHFEGN